MKQRVEITLTFSADLDMVPGWGHHAIDWVEFIRSGLIRPVTHYDTKIEIHEVKCDRVDPTKWVILNEKTNDLWNNEDGWVEQPEHIDPETLSQVCAVYTSEERIAGTRLPLEGQWVKVSAW